MKKYLLIVALATTSLSALASNECGLSIADILPGYSDRNELIQDRIYNIMTKKGYQIVDEEESSNMMLVLSSTGNNVQEGDLFSIPLFYKISATLKKTKGVGAGHIEVNKKIADKGTRIYSNYLRKLEKLKNTQTTSNSRYAALERQVEKAKIKMNQEYTKTRRAELNAVLNKLPDCSEFIY